MLTPALSPLPQHAESQFLQKSEINPERTLYMKSVYFNAVFVYSKGQLINASIALTIPPIILIDNNLQILTVLLRRD